MKKRNNEKENVESCCVSAFWRSDGRVVRCTYTRASMFNPVTCQLSGGQTVVFCGVRTPEERMFSPVANQLYGGQTVCCAVYVHPRKRMSNSCCAATFWRSDSRVVRCTYTRSAATRVSGLCLSDVMRIHQRGDTHVIRLQRILCPAAGCHYTAYQQQQHQ